MRIKPFRAVFPNFDYIASPDEFFGTVKEKYPEYKENGFFNRTSQESFYIYQIKTSDRTYTGLIACTDIQDYFEGKVKKHENTLAAKEQKQMNLILSRGAAVKPILLTHPTVPSLSSKIKKVAKKNKPAYTIDFEAGRQTHSVWELSDGKDIEAIQKIFSKNIPATYIADGHHRTSTTALMHQRMGHKKGEPDYSRIMCAFFPSSELAIHDFNRVIEEIGDVSLTSFIAKISQVCDIEFLEKAAKPSKKYELTMLLNKEWYRLTWKKEILAEYKKSTVVLDANLLDEKVLRDIIGIEDVRTDTRIRYVEGPKGIKEVQNRTNKAIDKVGFMLYPVELEDLMKVADANRVMPPKSTWFEPRMKNGLIVQEY